MCRVGSSIFLFTIKRITIWTGVSCAECSGLVSPFELTFRENPCELLPSASFVYLWVHGPACYNTLAAECFGTYTKLVAGVAHALEQG